jgi:hypothetical protein
VLCYAQLPIDIDATGDSVVLSLLWPQSSQEVQTGWLRSNLHSRFEIARWSVIAGELTEGFTVVSKFYTDSRKDKVLRLPYAS